MTALKTEQIIPLIQKILIPFKIIPVPHLQSRTEQMIRPLKEVTAIPRKAT